MYGCKTWATTKYLLSHLDAFDTWALCKILRIPYTCHVSDAEIRGTTGCSPLSHLVTDRRLRLFGHIARSSFCEDHHIALAAAIRQVPPDWKRPVGRPNLAPCNWGRPWPFELWPRDCLEKGHYSRSMATYCEHSSAPAEYAVKERKGMNCEKARGWEVTERNLNICINWKIGCQLRP